MHALSGSYSSVWGTELQHLSIQVPSALLVALTIPICNRLQGREVQFLVMRALRRCKLGETQPRGQSAGVMSQAAECHLGTGLGVTRPGSKVGAEESESSRRGGCGGAGDRQPTSYYGWAGGHSAGGERGLLGSSPPQSTLDAKCFAAQ